MDIIHDGQAIGAEEPLICSAGSDFTGSPGTDPPPTPPTTPTPEPSDPAMAELLRRLASANPADIPAIECDAVRYLRNVRNPLNEIAIESMFAAICDRRVALGMTSRSVAEFMAELNSQSSATNTVESAQPSTAECGGQFYVITGNEPGMTANPVLAGIYRDGGEDGPEKLTNFVVEIDTDTCVEDGTTKTRTFHGTILHNGESSRFTIDAGDYSSNASLQQVIFKTAGATVSMRCKPETLRQAISEISTPVRTVVTRNFGWNGTGDAFFSRSVVVTAKEVRAVNPTDSPRVDLSGQNKARHLDLAILHPEKLQEVKRVVAEQLVRLNDLRVTLPLLGVVVLAILERFLPHSPQRFALWLRGMTGWGKTFLARLFQCFFGGFLEKESLVTWTSTENFVEAQGHYFANAIYVVDDFKPELVKPATLSRIIQNYADRSGRGRLNADSTTKETKPIRGILICTGEDTIDGSASGQARLLLIDVPKRDKDPARAKRCQDESANFSGLTADLIRFCLATRETDGFAARHQSQFERLMRLAAGRPNDSRVASNVGLLGAGLEVAAAYFRPGHDAFAAEIDLFIKEELPRLMTEQLDAGGEAQEGRRFVETLGELIRYEHVAIRGYTPSGSTRDDKARKEYVGALAHKNSQVVLISMPLALGAVNVSLERQGRPPIRIQSATLLRQLLQEGMLVTPGGEKELEGGVHTHSKRIEGVVHRCVGFLLHTLVPLSDIFDS